MRMYLAFAVIALFVSSCSNEKRENELLDKISSLEKELDECKNGEERLFGILRNAVTSADHTLVLQTAEQIKSRYPGTALLDEVNSSMEKATNAIEAIKTEEKKRLAAELAAKKASLNKLNKKFDDVSGITWYKQKYFTHYTNSNRTSIEMGHRKGSKPWLNLMMSYTGDDWIFFEEAYLSYDGNTKRIYFNRYDNKKSDNDHGEVWEWIVVQIDDSEVEWFRNFAKSPNAKMRLSGKYTKTRNLSSQERNGIIDVLAGYDLLKENINL